MIPRACSVVTPRSPLGFLRGVAKNALKRRADKNDSAVGIHDADSVQQKIHYVLCRDALHDME
jgi:hypothetical protein